jgi:putative addiction module component (TIGR02574 family)
MADFDSVLSGAQGLSPEDRLRLIDALWDMVPPDANIPLHDEWAPELERRIAAIEAGSATTVSWTQIRSEALARIGHGNIR